MKVKNWEIGLAAGMTFQKALKPCGPLTSNATSAFSPRSQSWILSSSGLSNVSATYALNADWTIRVDNKGYNDVEQKWKESIGKAKPVKDAGTGCLKVSFFGPFYAGYNVIALNPDYRYALVASITGLA